MDIPSSSTPINLKPVKKQSLRPRKHPVPAPKGWKTQYAPSKDGREVNLLIMMHGLGDTNEPFFRLGQQFSLPATCVLSVQGNVPVPLMETPSWSWYPAFETSFPHMAIPSPSPDSAVSALRELLAYLIAPIDPPSGQKAGCGWELSQIHLFGWGQGGTTAFELGRSLGLEGLPVLPAPQDAAAETPAKPRIRRRLGSITSICGPLAHTPALGTPALDLPSPVCYFHRPQASRDPPSALRRTFKHVRPVPAAYARARADEQGEDVAMPTGEDEWREIMRFWSEVLGRADEGWKGEGEVYEVVR